MRKEEEEGREEAFLSSGNQNRRKDEKEKIVNRAPPTPRRKRKELGHPSFETPPPFFSDPCVNPLRSPDSFRIDVPLEALAARHHSGGSRRKRGWTPLTGRVRKGGSLSLSLLSSLKRARPWVKFFTLFAPLFASSSFFLPLHLQKKNGFRPRLPRARRRARLRGRRASSRLRGRRPRVGLRARGQARRPRRWIGR